MAKVISFQDGKEKLEAKRIREQADEELVLVLEEDLDDLEFIQELAIQVLKDTQYHAITIIAEKEDGDTEYGSTERDYYTANLLEQALEEHF